MKSGIEAYTLRGEDSNIDQFLVIGAENEVNKLFNKLFEARYYEGDIAFPYLFLKHQIAELKDSSGRRITQDPLAFREVCEHAIDYFRGMAGDIKDGMLYLLPVDE